MYIKLYSFKEMRKYVKSRKTFPFKEIANRLNKKKLYRHAIK